MIEAYIDESAKTMLGRPLYAVSGVVGTRDQWSQFEKSWQAILDEAGVPYYHGKEGKCDKLRRAMVSVIQSAGVRGFTTSTFQDEYAGASHELKSGLGNHYAFLVLSTGLHIRDWARRANLGPIAYVLEDGQSNIDHVMRLLESVVGPDAVSVECAGKRDFIGLQAADFVAHHTAALDVGLAWIRPLLGGGPGQVMWGHLDPSGIASASAGMSSLLRRYRQEKFRRKRERKANLAKPRSD